MPGEVTEKAKGGECVSDASEEAGVWRFARAERASVIVDAADYYAHMQDAMLAAERRIFVIGWDFDTRIHLSRGRRWWRRPFDRSPPQRLGSFIGWLVRHRPELEVLILKWSVTVVQFILRGTMLWDVMRWVRHKRISFKFDQAHPTGCSHHQKIAVLDNRLAVCGGIDMTDKRWDTRDHAEVDPGRKSIQHRTYGPWHDATMMMEGDIAGALAELGERRWERAGGRKIARIAPRTTPLWPERLEPQFENVEIGIARTRAAHNGCDQLREIEALFKEQIKSARRFIYAESQYFASRVIAETILARLQHPDPPEIVIVHPAHADGWLEQQAMDHSRAMLVRVIEAADTHGKFSLWTPYVGDTAIYVHAKIMIVDDEIFRIGSANLNNRSMGLDSECDVFIDSTRPANRHARKAIAAIRHSLLAEHLALEEASIDGLLASHGSMKAMIEASGERAGRHLRRYVPPKLNETEKKLAESEFLDPEKPEEIFEPFAKGGLFRDGSRLARMRERLHWHHKRKDGRISA